MNDRKDILDALERTPDTPVLILGGGVNGLGLLRELACQGVACLLVDKADFTAGASSKSSRMIHGGLRYLENGEFRLVRESLTERNRLLVNAPHYVAPLKTTIPLFSWCAGLVKSPLIFLRLPVKPGGRGALIVRAGLAFYDLVTWRNRRTPTSFLTRRGRALEKMPALNPRIVATATYWDAYITQAERLCIELLQDAYERTGGVAALNYAAVERLDDGAVVLRDGPTGRCVRVRPRIVVNATGAWVDIANRSLGIDAHYMGGTKGSHLVIDSEELHAAIGDQMVYYESPDGRICITFTFLGKVIMGSTDIRLDDPDAAHCDAHEVAYMLESLRRVFPDIRVAPHQIVYKFCGVRPLPAAEAGTTGRISRDHFVHVVEAGPERPFPVLSLVGGKWTTFRSFAAHTADMVLDRLGLPQRASTADAPIGGGRGFPADREARGAWIDDTAARTGLSRERVATLLSRYGAAAAGLAASFRNETPLATLPAYSREEIARIAAEEHVEHLTDLTCRRSVISLLGDARPDVLAELAEIAGGVLGWDDARKGAEVETAAADAAV